MQGQGVNGPQVELPACKVHLTAVEAAGTLRLTMNNAEQQSRRGRRTVTESAILKKGTFVSSADRNPQPRSIRLSIGLTVGGDAPSK